jgi:PAS domain S-box-containing protein
MPRSTISPPSPAERRLEALLDQLPYVVVYETGAGREYISPNIQQLLGVDAESLVAERGSFAKLIHPDDAPRLEQELQAWKSAGRPGVFRAQFRARTKEGSYVWLEDQIVAADNPEGKQSMIGVMVDISARRADQSRYQAIVEAADAAGLGLGIFLERENRPELVFMNASLQAIGGWTLDELRERNLFSILRPEHLQPALEIWRAFMEGSLTRHSFETGIECKDGRHVAVSLGLSVTRLDDERAIIAFITDISERKRFEHELIQAKLEAEEVSRIKSNILANFSHELRTPMHSILGFSSILVEELELLDRATSHELVTYARSIQRSGERLLGTLTSIIELAALESSPGEIVLYPMRLADVVKRCVDAFRSEFAERGLAYRVDIRSADGVVLLDAERFRKALDKILQNAIKFTSRGEVIVTVDRAKVPVRGKDEERMLVTVRDTGVGMSEQFLETAFEKFKQESTGLGRAFEGAGVGLTLAKGYLRMMNGSISITSEPQVGTSVTITLPIVG